MVEQTRDGTTTTPRQDGYYHRLKNRAVRLPRWARLLSGSLLIVCGLLGFLPVLGFWMIPLGLIVLSVDVAAVRRRRRRLEVWWERRRRRT